MKKKKDKEKKVKKNKAKVVKVMKNKTEITQEQMKNAATTLVNMLTSKNQTNEVTSYLADRLTEVVSDYKTTQKVINVYNGYSLEYAFAKEKMKDFLENVKGEYNEEPLFSSFVKKIRYNKINFTDLVLLFIICIQAEVQHINFGYLIGATTENKRITCKEKLPEWIQFWVVEQAIREVSGSIKEDIAGAYRKISYDDSRTVTDIIQALKNKGANVHEIILHRITEILELKEKENTLVVPEYDLKVEPITDDLKVEPFTDDLKVEPITDDFNVEPITDDLEEEANFWNNAEDDILYDEDDEDDILVDGEDLEEDEEDTFWSDADFIEDSCTLTHTKEEFKQIFGSNGDIMLKIKYNLDFLVNVTSEVEVHTTVLSTEGVLVINGKGYTYNEIALMLTKYQGIVSVEYRRL